MAQSLGVRVNTLDGWVRNARMGQLAGPKRRSPEQEEIARLQREELETRAVKVIYDARTDTLTIVLKEGAAIAESDEGRPGVVLDYDVRGDLVSLEILDASKRVTDAGRVEFESSE